MNLFQRNAKLIVVLAMISGSTSGILGKLITAGSMTIGFYRLSFCLPFFVVPLLIKHRKDIIEINKKQLLLCALGGVFLFGHFFCWYVAVKNTVIAYKTRAMNDFEAEYILSNCNTEPKLLNKIVKVADWWGETKKDEWNTEFIPQKIMITWLI